MTSPYALIPRLFDARRVLLAVLVLLVWSTLASAQPAVTPTEQWTLNVTRIETSLDRPDLSAETLSAERAELDTIREDAAIAIADLEERIAPLQARLASLGEAPEDPSAEPSGVAEERARLTTQISGLTGQKRLLDQLLVQIGTLTTQIQGQQRDIFERQMLTRAPSIFDTALWVRATETIGRKITQIGRESRAKISEKHMTGERVPLILFGALFTIGALILIFRAKRAAERWLISRLGEDEKPAHGVTIAVCLTIARLLLPAVAVTLVMAWLFTADILGTYGFRLIEGFAHTAMVVIGAYGLGGAFFAPHEPRLRISRFDDRCSRIAHYWLMA
ncbi:MAG: DUF3772 domain-containing protein, partial [Pseudomonadota bacterium]